ncbi:hypothetical protein G3O01_11070 [Burkholderia sp. Ac-20365]|nr:hypothetical protein [Burkholderia sp. Ac-20365]
MRRPGWWSIGGAAIVMAACYCVVTNLLFLQSYTGSFLMYRAGQLGLVSQEYANRHLLDIVMYRQTGDGKWEFRVPRPVIGYAAIPGLIAHKTERNLQDLCLTPDANGNRGCKPTP